MPPKPFNPPRPSSSSNKSTSNKVTKSKPKPKPTKPSTYSAPLAKSKSKEDKAREKAIKKVAGGRGGFTSASAVGGTGTPNGTSAGSGGRFHLPSLSPDSDVVMAEEEDGEEEEEEERQLSELSDLEDVRSVVKEKAMGRRRGSVVDMGSDDEDEEEEEDNEAEKKESIPIPLLQVLLQTHFASLNQNKPGNEGRRTRISKEAVQAVGKYIDTFVREAICRAAFDTEGGEEGNGEGGSGVLEVESLERICPQLLLDF